MAQRNACESNRSFIASRSEQIFLADFEVGLGLERRLLLERAECHAALMEYEFGWRKHCHKAAISAKGNAYRFPVAHILQGLRKMRFELSNGKDLHEERLAVDVKLSSITLFQEALQ